MVNWYTHQNESEQVVACSDSDWVRWMHPHRTARAKVLKPDTRSGGAECSGGRTGCSREGKSRGAWDDVFVDHPRTCDGRRKCSNRNHPSHGSGTVRHLNTSWSWVQEKEASRELQYHKVEGSDHGADLFTKALDRDSIVRHTEAVGREFMFGRDPIALTVNN